MSDSLEIFTLGKLQIQRNGLTLADFPTRKVEALLIYLACTGRSHPREQLAELLWDDRTQSQSLTNLRATLSRLNEKLAPFILINRKDISINPQAQVWVDSVELSSVLQSNKRQLSSSIADRLERTLTIYKGDFLAGFYINESQGFEDWQFAERERLRVNVMEALSQLANFHLERGRFDAGLTHAARLLELDPLREDAHRQKMMLLASGGQRSAALAHYDICREILAAGFGLEPEVATTTLYHKIRSGAFVPPTAPLKTTVNVPVHTLSALTEKTLVRASPSGRYDLHELLRQFAEEKLREADEFTATRDRHLDYFVTWAEEANQRLRGAELMTWYKRIETEHDNLRAALSWGIKGPRAETGLRLAVDLWWFWFRRGYWSEGFEWLKVGIERTDGDTSTRAYAMSYAMTLLAQLHTVMIGSYLTEGLRIGQKLGLQDLVAMLYVSLSFTESDYEKAIELLEQALSLLRQVDARFELTSAFFLYGDRARAQGDLKRAETLYQESLDIAQADQNRELMTSSLGNLGRLAVYREDYECAAALIQEAITIARELGSRVRIADWLVYLGTLELYRGNYSAAEKYLEETLALFRDLGNQMGVAHVYHCLANLALHQGYYDRAVKLISDSLSMAQSFLTNVSNREFSIVRLLIVDKLACARGDYEEASMLLGAVEALRKQSGYLLEPLLQVEYTEAVTMVRTYLDTAVFEEAWARGHAMTEAEATTSALGYVHTQFDVVW